MSLRQFPARDNELLAWAENLSQKVNAMPATYGVPNVLALALNVAVADFATALAKCVPGQRSKMFVNEKNLKRTAMKVQARFVINAVNAAPAVTDAQRIDLGITVRKQPSPRPLPGTTPVLVIGERIGTNVRLDLKAQASDKRRGKPTNVDGVAVFTYVGATPSSDLNEWTNHGYSGMTRWELNFPDQTAGTQVWFTAFWYNARGAGPGAMPVSTNLAGGSMSKATLREGLRVAA